MKCWTCQNAQSLPYDAHISCGNPPKIHLEIGSSYSPGNERYAIAEKTAMAEQAVVRCIWRGSGRFPFAFDGNTVFGCSNYQIRGKQ